MKDADYRNIKGILDAIDSLTHSADEFKKMQEEIKNSEVGAKLFLHINGQTREIILSEKIPELTLPESIKPCNDSVKKSADLMMTKSEKQFSLHQKKPKPH